MNVANLDNCKRLYELSHWQDVEQYWEEYTLGGDHKLKKSAAGNPFPQDKILSPLITPAYDAGYLLRKLPTSIEVRNHYLFKGNIKRGGWARDMKEGLIVMADTPEDALALLAIQLFEQGILNREDTIGK